MSSRRPLSQMEKMHIYRGKQRGKTLAELASEVDCSLECVRKWWRVGRDRGLEGLRAERRSRGPSGRLSQFDPRISERALQLKRAHPGWGADRVRVEFGEDPELCQLRLPSRSSLSGFFKQRCPECLAKRKRRPKPEPQPPKVTGVHECWELDSQEKILLQDGEIATVCNIRDPVGAAMIASRAFAVRKGKRWRKLTWIEVRSVLRTAFTEWHTLPDSILTDNELCLAGGPNDPFPGHLTFWLAGLGVKHNFIRVGCPTDQSHVERCHRTMDGWAIDDQSTANVQQLQDSLDRERRLSFHSFPTRASNCDRRPPLEAHPELLHPRRPYQPEWELALFDLQRVYDFLGKFTFTRRVFSSGQISLGRRHYRVGKKLARRLCLKTVQAHFDPVAAEWVIMTDEPEPKELVRCSPKGLTVTDLTGLTIQPTLLPQPIQLTLPFLAP